MQQTTTGYRISKGSASGEELEKYRLCFAKNGTERDLENLQWLHQQNLVHKHSIYYAYSGADIAAIYTALPAPFRINGSLFPALQSIDTLTDEAHRGKGLFIKLASKLYEEASTDDYALVYGFPNDQSAPGFFKKLGWTNFGEVPFLCKPLSVSYFLKKLLIRKKHTDFSSSNHIFPAPGSKDLGNGRQIKAIESFGAEYDQLWHKVAGSCEVSIDRTAAYMNWRFVNKPGEHYYRYALYVNESLVGIVIFSLKHKHQGLIGYLMELLYEPGNEQAGKELMQFATKLFRQQKTDMVLAWNNEGSFNRKAFKQAGYYLLPEKLRPQKLFIGARTFNKSLEQVVGDFKNWYISYADSDTA